MGGFDNPVERHRDEGVIVSRIERDKKGKEEFVKEVPDSVKMILAASILVYLKKLFDSYPIKFQTNEDLESNQVQILTSLQAFQNLLEHLGSKDQSNQPRYAHQLSELWHKLIEDFNILAQLERKNQKILLKLKFFLDEINHYPADQEHSFGYYLKEHAGEDWLPFPYMDILSKLHKEYVRKPNESHLSKWISMIDEILKVETLR